ATDGDGGLHELWVLDDPALNREIAAALAPRTAYIADGHHRYETALSYREEKERAAGRNPVAGWNFVMMFLVNLDAGGITILPTHRLIKSGPLPPGADVARSLAPWYDVAEEPGDAARGL